MDLLCGIPKCVSSVSPRFAFSQTITLSRRSNSRGSTKDHLRFSLHPSLIGVKTFSLLTVDVIPEKSVPTLLRAKSDDRQDGKPNDVEEDGIVGKINAALAKAFGTPLWYSVLLLSLAVFGGGYVYLILNYADFSDIPILNVPQR